MAHLYRHLRIHQIFGANTDVGKTVLTTALCRVSLSRGKQVFYLKPVSTGPPSAADDLHVQRHSRSHTDNFQAHCLFRYDEPMSPHLAVRKSNKEIISDEILTRSVADYIEKCARSVSKKAALYVETAGGVNSPTISGASQANAYRQLFLPVILIGDARLGGISSTMSAYESLSLRGYQVNAVAMFSDEYHQNHVYLSNYFAEQNISLFAVPPPPHRDKCPNIDSKLITAYYHETFIENGTVFEMDECLDNLHAARLEDLASMPRRTLDSIWWPFVQHQSIKNESEVMVIDSAAGDFFSTFHNGTPDTLSLLKPQLDGSASWWTQVIGHAHPSLTLAAAKAAGRYGHVMFPRATHGPALELSAQLIGGPGAGWASRVFFSDNGSTGMEVALKMAFRAFSKKNRWKKDIDPPLGVLGLKGSYHGDTIGVMDACEEGIYTCEWHNAKGYWLESPQVSMRENKILVSLPPSLQMPEGRSIIEFPSVSAVYDVDNRLHSSLAPHYRHGITTILHRLQKQRNPILAALVLEPLVLGAGGMIFVDPLFQRILVDTVRGNDFNHLEGWKGMPVIFDEVFVGLYRLGMKTCASTLGVNPDIAVYAKILTGGLVPMSVTLANHSIYEAFLGENKADALLHGHSYTAHPVGCQVALETLKQLERLSDKEEAWRIAKERWNLASDTNVPNRSDVWSFWDFAFVCELSMHPTIQEAMTLGTVLAFKVKDSHEGYGSSSAENLLRSLQNPTSPSQLDFSTHYRTLGNVAYFICSLNTPSQTLRSLEKAILGVL